MSALGIIAGGGELPFAIAESATQAGRHVFIAALQGSADKHISSFPHAWVSLGQTGRTLSLLREHGCEEVLLAGKVMRPNWSDIRFDAKALTTLPKVMAAAARGDDALLRSFVEILEQEGFRVVGAGEAAPGLLPKPGVLGRCRPSSGDEKDISLGARIVRALGAYDVGQAAIVSDGLVLAVEAAEGTDAMIKRVAMLSTNLHGTPKNHKGVLVKSRKPTQDGKTDLPVIGPETIKNAAAVNLAGIAIEAGGSLVVNRASVLQSADHARLFLYAFDPLALPPAS